MKFIEGYWPQAVFFWRCKGIIFEIEEINKTSCQELVLLLEG